MTSFTFYLSEEILILPLFLKDIFTGYRFWGWRKFSFITLKISFQYLLVHVVSYKKSSVITFFFYIMCLSSLANFKLFFVSLVLSNYDAPLCGFVWVYYAWGSLSFLELWVYCFHQNWKKIGYNLIKYFFCLSPPSSPSRILITCMLVLLVLCYGSSRFC